jgi:hypothetical protein
LRNVIPICSSNLFKVYLRVRVIVFSATFNNSLVISCTNHCCELEVSNKEMKIGLIGLVVLQPNYIDNWIRYTTDDRTLNRFINVVSTNPDVYSMQHSLDMNKCLHTGKCQFSLLKIYFPNTNLIYAIFIGEKTWIIHNIQWYQNVDLDTSWVCYIHTMSYLCKHYWRLINIRLELVSEFTFCNHYMSCIIYVFLEYLLFKSNVYSYNVIFI